MKPSPGTVDLASLAPPLRALFAGQQAALETLRAENAALTERNRRLEQQGPEALVEDLHAKVVSLTDRNRRLEHLVRELRRAMFGQKSEKLHPDQLLLAFEELEGALAEAEADTPASTTPTPRAKRPAAQRNLGHLPAHLPRIEQVIEPQSTLCPCGCGEMTKIGEDRTERLDVVPAQLQVIVTVRPKYACRKCEEGVTQAPAPAHLIEGGPPKACSPTCWCRSSLTTFPSIARRRFTLAQASTCTARHWPSGSVLFRRLFRERLTGLFRRVGVGISHIVPVLPDGLVDHDQAMA